MARQDASAHFAATRRICSNGSRGGRVPLKSMLLMSPLVPLDIMATKAAGGLLPPTRKGMSRAYSPK